MNDISSEFTHYNQSVLRKAFRISNAIDSGITSSDSSSNKQDLIPTSTEDIGNKENDSNGRNANRTSEQTHSHSPTRSAVTLSKEIILLENELQRREEVRKAMVCRIRHMEESQKMVQQKMAILKSDMALTRERLKMEELAHLEDEEKRVAQLVEKQLEYQQQLYAQRILERNERFKQAEAQCKKKLEERVELLARLAPLWTSFWDKYQDMNAVSSICKDRNAAAVVLAPYANKIVELHRRIEEVNENAKAGELTAADVNAAEVVVDEAGKVLDSFKSEIVQINAAYDAETVRREHEVNRAEIQTQAEAAGDQEIANRLQLSEQSTSQFAQASSGTVKDQELKSVVAKDQATGVLEDSSNGVNPTPLESPFQHSESTNVEYSDADLQRFVDEESLKLYAASQQFLESYVTGYQNLLESSTAKKFRFECQKAINVPVNAISGVSAEHLTDKYERLRIILSDESPRNITQIPQGISFCKEILARKIVSQGETLVSSKPEMVFPIAAVAVALWSDHPDFGDLLLAHFHKACPFTVPIFLPRQEGQSNEEYYLSLGYKYSEDGSVETQVKFLKRMSGLVRLYASLTVTRLKKGIDKSHPFGIRNAWRWLAATLNLEPRPDISDLLATLILTMLEVAGNTLWAAYPRQFPKMLTLLVTQYYPRMQSMASVSRGPLTRLEEFLKKCLAKGAVPPPEGELPPNFW